MAAGTAVMLCFSIFIGASAAQWLGPVASNSTGKICRDMNCNDCKLAWLQKQLENCVVIFGNFRLVLFEQAHKEDFADISFPLLREVTGYVAFYRVRGLESIGKLFPNLARIRGSRVLYNYALIIYDMSDLREVGLFNLLKIDRGGVIVWAVPHACFINTINWKLIAPRYRHILKPVEDSLHCTSLCSCTDNAATNYCWNVMKCQKYPEGVEGYKKCDQQCLGCSTGNSTSCITCREYTYMGYCVPKCPGNTLVLPDNGYCLTVSECRSLGGWLWNGTCVVACPIGYKRVDHEEQTFCVVCDKCEETCGSLMIQTLASIQAAGKCVHVDGFISIHIRFLTHAMEELRNFLGQIQDVSDYILIYDSFSITSLDFLSSLKRIGGQNLRNGTHSLIVYDMTSLQTLFSENVTKSLEIDNGSVYLYNNPMLCVREIEKIQDRFPGKPGPLDVFTNTNGYSGGCTNTSVELDVTVLNETSVEVNFKHVQNVLAHYSILYVRLPQGSRKVFVPETCSDSEWHAYNIPFHLDVKRDVILTNLRPASAYALCIEKYDPDTKVLARSNIFNFTTPVGKPEPPFILELVASSSSVVVLRWVDHKMYRSHIKRYELDVTLVDIYEKDVRARDHCKKADNIIEDYIDRIDYFQHAVVMRPPPEYDRGCESMCGVLSAVTAGAMVEEYFDACSSLEVGCDTDEPAAPKNSSFGKFVRTLSLNVSGPRNDFQVGDLAPFRDYRFRLWACTDNDCSRYARNVVRTLRSTAADVPIITYAAAAESGYISVKWKPPELVNGVVLSYSIIVHPSIKYDEPGHLVPQSWCELGDKTSAVVKAVEAKRYLVSVCSTTLGSKKVCSMRQKVFTLSEITYFSWGWTGIIFGVFIYVTSIVVGCVWKKRRASWYEMPLLEQMETDAVSEPPSAMMSDFMYTIPLRDIRLD